MVGGGSAGPRIAMVLKGDPSLPGAWSGVPRRLGDALAELGCEILPIDAEIPRGGVLARLLKRSWTDQAASGAFSAASSLTARLRLRRARPLDAIVAMGSGYLLRTDVPLATYEDMTVVQAAREGGPAYVNLTAAQIERWRARQTQAYEAARACCVASHWAAESIRDDYGIPESKIHVVGFGHNVEMEVPDRDWSVPRFLWVGADWERKRGAAIVAAFRRVRAQHPEATLDFVGNHPELDEPGVTGHGRLALGSEQGQREYLDLLRRSTCYVMPSLNEPLGIAYLDAGTAGVPSIGTTSGGARDAVADGGRVVDPADEEALAQAMLELCDPATAKALGERARARSELYTWRSVAERVLRALRPAGVDVSEMAAFIERPALAPAR